MIKKYFLDANVILRFILKDDPRLSQKAREIFIAAKEEKIELILVPEIIAETFYVLEKVYRLSREKINVGLTPLIKSPYLEVRNKQGIIDTLTDSIVIKIDFIDIYLFHLAKSENAEVMSFDKDFAKLAKR